MKTFLNIIKIQQQLILLILLKYFKMKQRYINICRLVDDNYYQINDNKKLNIKKFYYNHSFHLQGYYLIEFILLTYNIHINVFI